MPHFEQEIYQYVLFVGTITVIEAEFLTLEPAGGHKRSRRLLLMIQNNSNFGKSFHNHSSKFIQFCSTFSNRVP